VSKDKKLGIAAWALGLVLANVLLFCLSRGLTPTFWITFGFVWLAFLSSLIFQLLAWKRTRNPDEQALHLPALAISYIYMTIQIPLCVIFALGTNVIPWRVMLLIHAVLAILAWIVTIGSLAGNNHIQKVNGRQKDHHKEL
jgi:succinate-acetate transporter protein